MKAKRTGRPPRTDRPLRVTVRLPGVVGAWLKREAARRDLYQGDLISEALQAYRARRKG